MKLYVRCAILSIAALALAGCQTNDGKHRLAGSGISKPVDNSSWQQGLNENFNEYHSEPAQPFWLKRMASKHKSESRRARIGSIRQLARRLAPAGVNVSSLSRMVKKRRQAKIGCIPADLRMILNAVAWHYGKKVHIQSGYRSKHYNARVGGARRSFHVRCKAVDIQVSGVNKYKLAKYLKSLPGRGGVGTYCNSSTVHIDIGPRRSWHYGCGMKSKARQRLALYKKRHKKRSRRHRR